MARFNHQDFVSNPEKYRLFATARVASNVFTENGKSDLREDEPVAVFFQFNARNQLYRRSEPVYEIQKDGKFWGFLYASALKDFVL